MNAGPSGAQLHSTRARSRRRSNPIVESLGQHRKIPKGPPECTGGWRLAGVADGCPRRRSRLLVVRRAGFRVRPNLGATMAANRTDEQVLQIGQPQALGPAVSVDHNRMPTFVVAAEHPQPARAGLPHLSEGDLLLARHGPILPKITPEPEYAMWHRLAERQASSLNSRWTIELDHRLPDRGRSDPKR